MSEVLKRKFEEVEGDSPCSSTKDSEEELSGSESADSGDSINPPADAYFTPSSILHPPKRQRGKSVRFDQVTVYYFARRQGFTSVPSQGGSTLGMASRHDHVVVYSLGEFAREREDAHQNMLRQHLKEERLNSLRMQLTQNGTQDCERAARALTVEDIPDEEVDVRAVHVDDYFFLQPLPTRKRRAMLRASGVRRIDGEEKQQLRAIRVSREECGCDCRAYCDPETCPCSQAGISCQVDRLSFPCGCTKDGCGNPGGRIEFNPVRVRTHFIHTIMRLELEHKQAGSGEGGDAAGGPLGGGAVDGGLVHGAVERACGSIASSMLPQDVLGVSGHDNSPMMQLFAGDVMSGDAMSGEDGDPDSPSSGFASTLCSSEDGGDGTTGVEYQIPTALHLGRVEGELLMKGERVGDMSSYSLDSSLFSFPSDDLPSMSLFPSNSSSSCLFHSEEYGLGCVLPQSPLHGSHLQDAPAALHAATLQEMSPTVYCGGAQDGAAASAAHGVDMTPLLTASLQEAPAPPGVLVQQEPCLDLGVQRSGARHDGAALLGVPPGAYRDMAVLQDVLCRTPGAQEEVLLHPQHAGIRLSMHRDIGDGGAAQGAHANRNAPARHGAMAFAGAREAPELSFCAEVEADQGAGEEQLLAARSLSAGRSGSGERLSPPTNGFNAGAAASARLTAGAEILEELGTQAGEGRGITDECGACCGALTYGLAGQHLALPDAHVSKELPATSVAEEPECVPHDTGSACGAQAFPLALPRCRRHGAEEALAGARAPGSEAACGEEERLETEEAVKMIKMEQKDI